MDTKSLAQRERDVAARELGKAELALELASGAHPSARAALIATAEYHRNEAARHQYNSMMACLDLDPELPTT